MMPVGMERFTATTRPTVAECLRLAGEADVLVGIIAWRYGWIPPGQELSITELEYGAASQRLIFVLDPEVAVNPDKDFDPGPERWQKQQKLEAFKQRINADQMPGHFTEQSLGTVVMQALEQWRKEHAPDTSGPVPKQSNNVVADGDQDVEGNMDADPEQLHRVYLRHLYEDSKHISLQSFAKEEAEKGQSLVELGAIYTALGTGELERRDKQAKENLREPAPAGQQRYLSAVQLVNNYDHVVLLGDPGSGKSTFVKFLTLCMAGDILGEAVNLDKLRRRLTDQDDAEQVGWQHGQLLPVFIQLSDFAVKSLPPVGQAASALHVWNYLQNCLKDWGIPEYFKVLRQDVLDQDTTSLLLFDGLDEVPDPPHQRMQIKQAIEDFVKAVHCRVIVTSRTYAYQKQAWELEGFHAAELAPFDEAQIRTFIDQWYAYQAQTRQRDSEDAQGRAKLLKDAVFEKNRRLHGLAERPLLLTLMAVLHSWHGRDLPEKRVDIYEQTLELLIHRWNSRKETLDRTGRDRLQEQDLSAWLRGGRAELRRLLERLAFEAHGCGQSDEGCADVSKKELIYGLSQICKDPNVHPDKLEEYVKDRMGILIERGHEVFTFPHRTFQEYLAACYLTSNGFPKQISDLTRQDPQRWREVAQLVGLKVNTAHSVLALAQRLSGKNWAKTDAWGTLVAGEFLAESDCCKQFDEFEKEQFTALRKRLAKVLEKSSLPAVERAMAGRLLGQLGDPRPEVMAPEKMPFERVPAGSFWMGVAEHDSDAYDYEKPGFDNCLDYGYYLSRFPVSNAQYRCFVEAEGYKEKQYWQEAIADGRWKAGKVKVWDEWKTSPEDYGVPFNLDSHPVVGVSWYEAMAFCRWLTDYLKNVKGISNPISEHLAQGWCFVLPSEAEWEKAARGTEDRRIYPWGEKEDADKMNYSETKIGSTSALGCFPKGSSPFKCEEMLGNVWEWCRTPWQGSYEHYKNEPAVGGKETSRVVRGGAFDFNRYYVRCSSRFGFDPDRRLDIGFRVSLSPFL
jgi:formylglycine-generating enzyme required for sulfatase activity